MYVSVYIYWNHMQINEERTPVSSEIVRETTIIKELNLGLNNLDTLNPVKSNNKGVQNISKLIYDSLFTINGENKLMNNLVEEMAKLSERVYLVKLKDGIYWHNGDKFTSRDVQYAIEYMQSNDGIYKANVANIEDIKIIDGLIFRIHLLEKDDDFQYNLTFPIINKNENIGTGMFKLQNANNDQIVLVQNSQYARNYASIRKDKHKPI